MITIAPILKMAKNRQNCRFLAQKSRFLLFVALLRSLKSTDPRRIYHYKCNDIWIDQVPPQMACNPKSP